MSYGVLSMDLLHLKLYHQIWLINFNISISYTILFAEISIKYPNFYMCWKNHELFFHFTKYCCILLVQCKEFYQIYQHKIMVILSFAQLKLIFQNQVYQEFHIQNCYRGLISQFSEVVFPFIIYSTKACLLWSIWFANFILL